MAFEEEKEKKEKTNNGGFSDSELFYSTNKHGLFSSTKNDYDSSDENDVTFFDSADEYDEDEVSHEELPSTILENSVSILSIDGGGIRGIIPCKILDEIKQNIDEKLSSNIFDSNVHIHEMFDFYAGSSTGGLIIMSLLCPKYDIAAVSSNDNKHESISPVLTIKQLIEFYQQRGTDIFNKKNIFLRLLGSAFYNEGINDITAELFGKKKLSDLIKPCIFLAYDIERRNIHVFNSYKAKRSPKYDFYLADIARAITAAPTYFDPVQVKNMNGDVFSLIDGGVGANNPCIRAIVESVKIYPDVPLERYLVLSLGTGSSNKPFLFEDTQKWYTFNWILPVIDICMQAQSNQSYMDLQELIGSFTINNNFGLFRIQTILENSSEDMANVTPQNLLKLILDTEKTIEHHKQLIDNLVERMMYFNFSHFYNVESRRYSMCLNHSDHLLTSDNIVSNEQLNMLYIDNLMCGLVFYDKQGFIYAANKSFAQKLGVAKNFLKGKNIKNIIPYEKMLGKSNNMFKEHSMKYNNYADKPQHNLYIDFDCLLSNLAPSTKSTMGAHANGLYRKKYEIEKGYFKLDYWYDILIKTDNGSIVHSKMKISCLDKKKDIVNLSDMFDNETLHGFLMQFYYDNFYSSSEASESIIPRNRLGKKISQKISEADLWGFLVLDHRGFIINFDFPFLSEDDLLTLRNITEEKQEQETNDPDSPLTWSSSSSSDDMYCNVEGYGVTMTSPNTLLTASVRSSSSPIVPQSIREKLFDKVANRCYTDIMSTVNRKKQNMDIGLKNIFLSADKNFELKLTKHLYCIKYLHLDVLDYSTKISVQSFKLLHGNQDEMVFPQFQIIFKAHLKKHVKLACST